MGQYYIPVILGERYGISATLYAHDYENGLKLTEHSFLGNNFVNAVLTCIHHQPMRVAWVGDYSTDNYPEDDASAHEPYQRKMPYAKFMRIFEKIWGHPNRNYRRIKPEPLDGFESPEKYDGHYLINHTRKTYVDLGDYQRKNGWEEKWNGKKSWWSMNPLPLLTACGNGRGGGDYHDSFPDYDKVGLWAFDQIEFSESIPVGYTCEEFKFKEET